MPHQQSAANWWGAESYWGGYEESVVEEDSVRPCLTQTHAWLCVNAAKILADVYSSFRRSFMILFATYPRLGDVHWKIDSSPTSSAYWISMQWEGYQCSYKFNREWRLKLTEDSIFDFWKVFFFSFFFLRSVWPRVVFFLFAARVGLSATGVSFHTVEFWMRACCALNSAEIGSRCV